MGNCCGSYGFDCLCPSAAQTNPEVAGYIYNGPGRGMQYLSQIFLLGAFLYHAKLQANCYTDDELQEQADYCEDPASMMNLTRAATPSSMPTAMPTFAEEPGCEEKVYGFYPSSLITLVQMFCSLVTAFCCPVIGAIVDFTPNRRTYGYNLMMGVVVINAIQIFTNSDTWFFMLLLQGIAGALYTCHQICLMAYVPELGSSDVDGEAPKTEDEINAETTLIMGVSRAVEQLSNVIYILIHASFGMFMECAVVIPFGDGNYETGNGRVAQVMSVVIGGPLVWKSWQLLGDRPALHPLPDGTPDSCFSLIGVAWGTILNTACNKLPKQFPMTGLFLLAYTFTEAAAGTVLQMATIYLGEVLKMRSMSYAILIILVFNIVGALSTMKLAPKVGLQTWWKCSVWSYIILMALLIMICKGPDDVVYAYILFIPLGMTMASLVVAQRAIFARLVPGGDEAEFYGFYTMASVILGWLPNLLITIVMEANGGDPAAGMPVIMVFFLTGFLIFHFGIDFERAHADIAPTLKYRHNFENVQPNDDKATLKDAVVQTQRKASISVALNGTFKGNLKVTPGGKSGSFMGGSFALTPGSSLNIPSVGSGSKKARALGRQESNSGRHYIGIEDDPEKPGERGRRVSVLSAMPVAEELNS